MSYEQLIIAAQEVMGEDDVVYLHNAEGAPVIAMVAMPFYREMATGPHFPPREYTHNHIEPGEDVEY